MSHDAHPPAATHDGPGIVDTMSSWATPEGAESSTTVVKMVSDLTGKTVDALRAAIAVPITGGASLLAGAVTVANKVTLGTGYTVVNKLAQITNDSAGKLHQFISGNKA